MNRSRLSRLWNMLVRGRIDLPYDRIIFHAPEAAPRRVWNFLLSRMESRCRRPIPVSYPIGLQIEPTVECPLSCPLCPRQHVAAAEGPGHMPWEGYARLLEETGPSLTAVALWQWGEPLLHPRIVDMVRLAHGHGIITFLSTNGQVDPGKIDLRALSRSGLDMLIISLDGIRQDTYERIRAKGKVSRTIRFVHEAVRSRPGAEMPGPLINVRLIATRENEAEIPEVEAFAREAGADLFSVKGVSLYRDDSPSHPRLPANPQWRTFQYRGKAEADAYREAPNLCPKPWTWPTLRHDGTLLLCECDHAHASPLGNVFRAGSFRAVWKGAAARRHRGRFHRDGRIDLDFCRRCRYKRDDAIRAVRPLRDPTLEARLVGKEEPE